QVKDINKATWDATTSREAFESYAVAGATAALTLGATNWVDTNLLSGAISSGSNTGIAARAVVSSASSSAVQSAINGDSFSEAFTDQLFNMVIAVAGSLAANKIGTDYKLGEIGKTKQLALHAILGCGMAEAGGNDCASGAVSGVAGELGAEILDNNFGGLSNAQIIELSGLIGGYSSIFTGNAVGLSDEEIADNIFSGQMIGKNAAENNAIAFRIDRDGAGGNGHMTGYFQDENGDWYQYDQYTKRFVIKILKDA
ncbi:MAG: hypothetical protein ACJAW3_000107, partial [Lentimonas sp.]